MADLIVVTVIVLIFLCCAPFYVYLLARIVANAYFASKHDYTKNLLNSLEPKESLTCH